MKKVLIGMSGGVDSSVAAYLLKKQGYEVIGATMVLFDDSTIKGGCLSTNAVVDAKIVCEKLGIEHYVLDFKDEFKKKVISDFIDSYKNGFTPNPCVQCNKYLKFGTLYEKAKELGCDYIATGHYAKIKDNKLMISDSKEKDQSYFLYKIDKEVLSHIIFPLESYHNKDEIRQIAKDNNLVNVADKKDSQDVCFIPSGNYGDFLEKNLDKMPDMGNFIDKEGNIIGKHKGLIYYTIGQRRGLNLRLGKPGYVISIKPPTNEIVIGDENDLYTKDLVATNINILVDNLPSSVMAKIRFKAPLSKAKIEFIDKNNIKVIFEEPQRAVTKGQSIVFYDENDVCLGGGIIK